MAVKTLVWNIKKYRSLILAILVILAGSLATYLPGGLSMRVPTYLGYAEKPATFWDGAWHSIYCNSIMPMSDNCGTNAKPLQATSGYGVGRVLGTIWIFSSAIIATILVYQYFNIDFYPGCFIGILIGVLVGASFYALFLSIIFLLESVIAWIKWLVATF
jgi:hypothetical protein